MSDRLNGCAVRSSPVALVAKKTPRRGLWAVSQRSRPACLVYAVVLRSRAMLQSRAYVPLSQTLVY
jgi:hypothetical protein